MCKILFLVQRNGFILFLKFRLEIRFKEILELNFVSPLDLNFACGELLEAQLDKVEELKKFTENVYKHGLFRFFNYFSCNFKLNFIMKKINQFFYFASCEK